MHCSHVESKFDRYIDGDLRTTERLCVAVHLSQCYTCRETLDEYKSFDRAISSGLRHPRPASHFAGVMARVRLNERIKRPRFNSRFQPWYVGKRFVLAGGLILTTAIATPWILDSATPKENAHAVGSAPRSEVVPPILRTLADRAQGIINGDDVLPGGYDSAAPRNRATAETPDAPL